VRKAKYDLNDAEIKPFFRARHAVTLKTAFSSRQISCMEIAFKERKDIPVCTRPMCAFFGSHRRQRKPLALFYCDYFKRDNKNGGCLDVRICPPVQAPWNLAGHLQRRKPAETSRRANPPSSASTMSRRCFHEFGHALHGMFADTQYPTLSGTSTARDFVEFPSQFNEHWALYPAVFNHYAKHYKTGAAMPANW